MYILTGAAGFIGSVVLEKLNAAGIDDVLIIDNLASTEKWKNLLGKNYEDYIQKDDFLRVIEEDILPSEIKAVIHLGACSSTTEQNAEYIMQNNYIYSKILCHWALTRNVRFIYASSAATYGDGTLGFSDDLSSANDLRPLNAYGYSKHAFDLWLIKNNLVNSVAGLKFFNVYGPNEYHKEGMHSVVLTAYKQIIEKGSVNLFKSYLDKYADGEQKRDFIYVKDCADVILWLLENENANGIFNLGTGKARSWNDLVNATFSAMDIPSKINYIEMPEKLQKQYQYFTEAKIDKLREAGYEKEITSLEDGVADYVRNYLMKEGAERFC